MNFASIRKAGTLFAQKKDLVITNLNIKENDMNKKVPLEDIPLNSFHKKLTFYSAGGPFLDGYVLSIIGVVMLQLSDSLQLTTLWQGLIASSALIGVFLGGSLEDGSLINTAERYYILLI